MGMLRFAGALAGTGQGIVANAEFEKQMNALKTQNDLAQARQEAIERLKGAQAESLQGKQIQGEKELESQREAGALKVGRLQVGGRIAQEQMHEKFQGTQLAAQRATQLERERIRANARVTAADKAHQPRTTKGRWQFHTVTMPTTMGPSGPTGGGSKMLLEDNQTGQQFVQVGDKFMPYDASKDSVADAGSVRRAADSEVQKLIQNPQAAPQFLQTYHYLPMQWFSAAQGGAGQQAQQGAGKWGPGAVPQGAQVSEPQPLNTGEGDAEEAAENAADDEQDNQTTQGIINSNPAGED